MSLLAAAASARKRPAAAAPAVAPLLYWPLNETSGTVANDLSGNGFNGTIDGGTLSSSGLTLNALSDGVFYPGNVAGSPLDVGCLAAWAIEAVVTRNAPGGSVFESIVNQWRSPNFGLFNAALLVTTAGRPEGGMSDSLNAIVSAPTPLVTGVRTHLMAIRNGGALTMYVDGSPVATLSVTGVNTPSNGAGFGVGGFTQAGYFPQSYGFLGKVEHVAVYNKAVGAAFAASQAQKYGL